jgi:NTE family protein
MKYEYGLVLSGGGTRGFAHLGAIKALEENNIKPDIISGVSAGSIVGALYADGRDAEKALKALISKNLLGFLKPMIPVNGLIKMTGFEKTLKKTLNAKTFEELKTPLIIHAVNINTNEYTRFEKGDLVKAIKASSSIPVVFPPVIIDGYQYLDGGIINNFPVEALLGKCEKIIGINVNPVGQEGNIKGLKKIAIRAFHLSMRNHAELRKDKCDIYIEPGDIENFGVLDLSNAEKIFEIGYKKTIEVLKNR